MNNFFLKGALPIAALALVLTACGGGGDFENEPRGSTRPASATVAGSTDTSLNGAYTTNDVFLNDVVKVNPIGGDPETCRIRFANLPKTGSPLVVMDGDIRYIPGTTETRVTVVSIATNEFRLVGTTGTLVNRTANTITYTNAVLESTTVAGRTITLSGTIPIRAENKPEGC
jgi:hypothetical protein